MRNWIVFALAAIFIGAAAVVSDTQQTYPATTRHYFTVETYSEGAEFVITNKYAFPFTLASVCFSTPTGSTNQFTIDVISEVVSTAQYYTVVFTNVFGDVETNANMWATNWVSETFTNRIFDVTKTNEVNQCYDTDDFPKDVYVTDGDKLRLGFSVTNKKWAAISVQR